MITFTWYKKKWARMTYYDAVYKISASKTHATSTSETIARDRNNQICETGSLESKTSTVTYSTAPIFSYFLKIDELANS